MKQEPQMICPKAKECGIKTRVCAKSRVKNLEPHCEPHEWKISCDSESVTHYCPACIPYEPTTCPDCGHPAHKVRCTELIPLERYNNDRDLYDYRACGCTPADLQPKKQAKPFERYDKYEVMKLADIDKYLTQTQKDSLADIIHIIQDGRGKDGKIPCNSYVVVKEGLPYTEQVWQLIEDYETKPNKKSEQPTQMPLREQFIEQLEAYRNSCIYFGDKDEDIEKQMLDALESAVEAHDSAIAAQARKRTLKYVEATLERAFVNLSPIEQGVLNICLAHIRAMAKE